MSTPECPEIGFRGTGAAVDMWTNFCLDTLHLVQYDGFTHKMLWQR